MGNYDQPDVVSERVRFFDGQFLVDQDFIDEQHYHLDRQRRLPKALRVHGIVDGLEVNFAWDDASGPDSTAVLRIVVDVGTAIDEHGHQLVLTSRTEVRVPNDETLAKYTAVHVTLLYRQTETRPTPRENTSGLKENTRFDETPVVAVIGVTADGSEFIAADPPGALAGLTAETGTVLLGTFTRREGTLEFDQRDPAGYAGLWVLGSVGVGTHEVSGAKLRVTGGDTDLGGGLTVSGIAKLGGDLNVAGSAYLSNGLQVWHGLTVNHLRLQRDAAETTAGRQVFLELVQSETGVNNLPAGELVHPTILFGHANKFFNRIEAQQNGFHLMAGGTDVAAHTDLTVQGFDAKGPVELESYVRIGAANTVERVLHVLGKETYIEGDLFVKGQLAYWWGPDKDNEWKVIENGADNLARSYGKDHVRLPSDARLKTVDGPVRDAMATVLRLAGVRYRWSETGTDWFTRGIEHSVSAGPDATEAEHEALRQAKRREAVERLSGPQIGLIAQDVERVVPEVVTEDGDGYKYVNYGHLIALLIEAIKEQQAAIEHLSTRREHTHA